jgi:hypothetical protein
MTSQTNSLAELISHSGRNDATIARRCKVGIGTVQRWRAGSAPRYKFVPALAKALLMDEQVLCDAVRRANIHKMKKAYGSDPMKGSAQVVPNCDEVTTACLDALALAQEIALLPKDQRSMIQQFVTSLG